MAMMATTMIVDKDGFTHRINNLGVWKVLKESVR